MSLREKLMADIAALPEEHLPAVLELVRRINNETKSMPPGRKLTLGEKLRKIKTFHGPPDFSENIDLYLSGEKHT